MICIAEDASILEQDDSDDEGLVTRLRRIGYTSRKGRLIEI